MFGGNFAPAGWMFCEGQLLPISENETLFQLIGTTYGGDGESTFGLPDLRGRVPIHQGQKAETNYVLAETGGVESVTLTTQQIPVHNHAALASGDASTQPNPNDGVLAVNNVVEFFSGDAPGNAMAATSLTPAGGSQPHDNLQPYLCVDFIISLFGLFPSPT
jgi:microcystin-dependent protein